MTVEEKIKKLSDDAVKMYHHKYDSVENFPEITDDVISKFCSGFMLSGEVLEDAWNFVDKFVDTICENTYDKIDGSIPFDERKNTEEFKQWRRHCDIKQRFYDIDFDCKLDRAFVEMHGKIYSDEIAAQLAADKWCEIIFNSRAMKDNGALDENTSFMASLLSTSVGNDVKDGISDNVIEKARELLFGYYLATLRLDIEWLKENIPTDSENDFRWGMFDRPELSTDYHPDYRLSFILIAAGVDEKNVDWICPWKTSIIIRNEDNRVIYRTYKNREFL